MIPQHKTTENECFKMVSLMLCELYLQKRKKYQNPKQKPFVYKISIDSI